MDNVKLNDLSRTERADGQIPLEFHCPGSAMVGVVDLDCLVDQPGHCDLSADRPNSSARRIQLFVDDSEFANVESLSSRSRRHIILLVLRKLMKHVRCHVRIPTMRGILA
jgi:hypothetical protein